MEMENHILQMLGFSRCHLGFRVFFFKWFVVIVLLRLSWLQSNPVLKERTSTDFFFRNCPGESSGWCHVSKDAGNDLNEFNKYFDINFARHAVVIHTVICTSAIGTVKQHSFNWKAYVFEFELSDDKTNHSTICLYNDLIVIYRTNLRGSFSDPILSSGCSCVKRHLMWHPMSVSPAKRVVFRLRIVLPNTIIVRLAVCVSIVPIVLHVLHIFQIGQRRGVLRVYDAVSQRSPAAAGWMALELWRCIGSQGKCGKHSVWVLSNQGKISMPTWANLKKTIYKKHAGSRLVLAVWFLGCI